jgi:hypothetical protein
MMVIGRLRPDRKSKWGTKSGRPRARRPKDDEARSRSRSRQGRLSNSLLEQLPTELLQDIFLFSANLNLPLCSKQILGALTSDHLKFEVTLQILVYQCNKLDSKDRSLLLSRRFFDWEFLVRYFSFAHTRIDVELGEDDSDDDSDDELDLDEDEGYAATERSTSRPPSRKGKGTGAPPSLHNVDMQLTTLAKNAVAELRREEFGSLLEMYAGPNFELARLRQLESLQGLKDLQIPEKLMHDDWNNDRLRMLRLLIGFNCTVNRSLDSVADRGIVDAITQEDEEVVSYFVGPQILVEPNIDLLREAMKRTNLSIVFQLLRASRGEIDNLDPQVWRLLEGHMGWSKREKAAVKRWLQEGVEGELGEENTGFLPRLRDIDLGTERWTATNH